MTGEVRCVAGQASEPTAEECNRHHFHHFCPYCGGWYGVPHDYGCHSRRVALDGDVPHPLAGCACRYCALCWSGDHPSWEQVAWLIHAAYFADAGQAERTQVVSPSCEEPESSGCAPTSTPVRDGEAAALLDRWAIGRGKGSRRRGGRSS